MSGLADLRLLIGLPVLGALLVGLGPARWRRAIGGGAAGLALLVALAVVSAPLEGLALRVSWVGALGLSCSLGLGALGVPGLLVTCLIGQVAAVAPGGSRGSIAGGLLLQAVVVAALLARDLGLLVACYGLLAPLLAGLVASGAAASRVRAALAVGFYLSLGTALLALAVGALAVAHHDASGGVWSLELEALGGLLLPARAEAAIAAALGLAGALTLGLWPLHGWLIAGVAAARPGVALLVAGPLRWLGLDLLLRVWLVVTPSAAAAQAPAMAWVAVLGAVYGALVARAEPEPARALGLAALVPAGLLVLGIVGQHHEGVLGALGLGMTLCLGGAAGVLAGATGRGWLRRVARIGLLPAPGLVGLVGAALVVIGTARFAGLTLAGHAMSLALVGGAALLLSLRALSDRTGYEGHVVGDRSWTGAGLVAALLMPLLALGVAPGPGLRRVDAAGRAAVDAAMRRRCERALATVDAPTRVTGEASEACAQPLRTLEALQGGDR